MILVTGANGLVGSHLVQKLVAAGKTVRALYRTEIPVIEGANGVEWFKGDILDVIAMEQAMEGVKQVYHCAATVSFNPRNKARLHHTNVEGTANVVNASLNAGIDKMVFVSSVAALGRIREDKPINETMNWSEETSNSEYGKSKYFAEMEVWRGIGEGLNAVIVNPTIILGAGDWSKGSTEIFKSAYDEFPWYTEGTGGFVDVLDVVKAMMLLMDSDRTAERYILSAENLTYKRVFDQIAYHFEKKAPYKKVTPFITNMVWRMEAFKSFFTGKEPMLTKETAKTAAAKVRFDNNKLKLYFVNFRYNPMEESIERICAELREKYRF